MSTIYDYGYRFVMGHHPHMPPIWKGIIGIIGSIAYIIHLFGLLYATPMALRYSISDLSADKSGIDPGKYVVTYTRLLAFGEFLVSVFCHVLIWVSYLPVRGILYCIWAFYVISVPVYLVIRYFSEDAYTPNAAHY